VSDPSRVVPFAFPILASNWPALRSARSRISQARRSAELTESGHKNRQLFLEVTAKKRPGTWETFLLPHFGHRGFALSCSEMLSVRVNLARHLSQRYWYVGMVSPPGSTLDAREQDTTEQVR
jgi:hypothetical protein